MGAHPRQLPNRPDGTIPLDKIEAAIRANDQHFPSVTRVVCLENTHNKCGGRVLPVEYVDKVVAACKSRGVATHMDGARLWNARRRRDSIPHDCSRASTRRPCAEKGLGAPVGSVILGTAAFAAKCRRLRKACGGTMRQVGTLAAAALAAHGEIFPRCPPITCE